jgi:DNA primase catalytic core
VARFTDDELRRLKEGTDLAALVRASGVDLKQVGHDLRGRCPFHEDDGPSLVVTPSKNLWHCLGACQVGGSAIDWVMKSQAVSFRHAVEILRSKVAGEPLGPVGGVRSVREQRAGVRSSVKRLPAPVTMDADDQKLLGQVVGYYHDTLLKSPEALQYLKSRGLESSELVTRFKLGYSNRTIGYRLPDKNRQAGAEVRTRLAKLGIFRESGHEHLAGSLTIPILDEHGNVQGLYGRKIHDNLREGTPKHLYLPGPHRGVWNVEALAASKEIVLCEALIDAMTFWCAGYRAVTTSYGVSGFTPDLLEAFRKHGTRKILIAYDRDDAGDQAAEKLSPKLAEIGIDVYRVLFPKGLDANAYARKVTPASESLGVALRSAAFVVKGKRPGPPDPPGPPRAENPSPAAPAAAAEAPAPLHAPDPVPPSAASSLLRVEGDQADLVLGDRHYRVRGLTKNLAYDVMRVNVRVSCDERYHVDTVDLLSARQRAVYIKQASDELGLKADVVKKDLGKLLLELEIFQEKRIKETLAPKEKTVQLSEAEKAEAIAFLRDPALLDRIVGDFERVGLVGERTNKLVGYLAAVSRKLEDPLALLIQSNSAAGKSTLMDAVLSMMPEEEVERYTAMTGQSLYYMADSSLKHKILSIAEAEGALRAGYAIKMLQSEGRISIATTVKNPETGDLQTKRHEVEGPVAVLLTTTSSSVDEELQNRAVVLTVDEDRGQTRAIHERQRRAQTLEGMLARADRAAVLRLHQNAQRLLKPILVTNPYADRLTFIDSKLRTRRDHVKYLTLIRTLALLHQYQRPLQSVEHHGKTLTYIEATLSDVEVANRLAAEVLGRSLDELAPQTRRLLLLTDELVRRRAADLKLDREDYRFSRRDLRDYTRWGDTQLRTHLERLVELEYVLVHRGGRGQSFVYELLWDGQGKDGRPFLVGLLDPAALRYNSEIAGKNGRPAAPSRPGSGPPAGGVREAENGSGAPLEGNGSEIPVRA